MSESIIVNTRERERERERPRNQTKESLIESLEIEKVAGSLEPTNFELLKKLILKADNIDEAISIRSLGLTFKKTGLFYQQRLEKKQSDMIHYLSKDKKLSFDQGGIHHKLIIGDNYHALKNLLITHRNKIDIIYIDPPYGCNDMGEFAKTNYDNNITRDNLLSMLEPRLRLARELLTDRGVIFCSIDDKNQAYLKLLFDDVFLESNFYGNIIQYKGNTQNDSKTVQKNCDYILVYCKEYKDLLLTYINDVDKKVYEDKYYLGRDTGASSGHDKLIERANLGYTVYYIETNINGSTGNHNKLIERASLLIPGFKSYIKGNKLVHAIATADYKTDKLTDDSTEEQIYSDIKELIKLGYTKIRPPKRKGGKLGCWTWSLDTFKEYWNDDQILIKNDKNIVKKEIVDVKDTIIKNGQRYLTKSNKLPIQNIMFDFSSAQGTIQLSSDKEGIIPGCKFSNPKNPDMLTFLIKSYENKNAVVLDFFAGSGTTGQSVLKANLSDNGTRKFILCTNNEVNDNYPNGIAYDVTSERLHRVMTGKTSTNKSDFPWIKNNKPFGDSLDVYNIEKVNTISKEPFEKIKPEDYDLHDKKTIKQKIEWVCQNFDITMDVLKEIKE